MRKNPLYCISGLFFIILLPSCSQALAATNGIATNIQSPSKTQTARLTLSLSPTDTKTLTPTITPTIGPPPDLEFVNPMAYPEHKNAVGDDYYILGRIRNNTDQIMVFFWDDIVFRFSLEAWQRNTDGTGYFYHSKYIDEAVRSGESTKTMNCILYPGDEGVYYYHTRSNRKEYILWEDKESYDGALGLSILSYESFYRTNPELPPNLHLAIENTKFQKVNGDLDYEFDVLKIPQKMSDNSYDATLIYTWVILYDSQERIINILFRDIGGIPGLKRGEDFHIHGNTSASYSDKEKYFRPVRDITSDMVDNVTRIEVLTEYTEGDMCSRLSFDN